MSQASFFDTTGFMPHGHCFLMKPDVLWMHIISDGLIIAAYFSIPLTLLYFVRQRKDIAFSWVFWLFAAFILLCGITHIFGIYTIWVPSYYVEGWVKLLCGFVSVATAIALIPVVPRLLAMRSPAELESEITERKAAENQLQSTLVSLSRSYQDLDRFTSIAAHDLHEPLRKIITFGGMLKGEAKSLNEDEHQYLDYMCSAATRMQELLTSLRRYSRLTSDSLERELVDLNVVVKDVCSDIEMSLQDSQAKVEFKDLPSIHVDEQAIRQLLQNLIQNAIKFQKPGEVPCVQVTATRTGRHWDICVADNGIGIAEEHQQQVFEVFKRLHNQEEYPGTGIGLAICQRICELHGGEIQMESEVGVGTRFHVQLPHGESV